MLINCFLPPFTGQCLTPPSPHLALIGNSYFLVEGASRLHPSDLIALTDIPCSDQLKNEILGFLPLNRPTSLYLTTLHLLYSAPPRFYPEIPTSVIAAISKISGSVRASENLEAEKFYH